MLVNGSHQMNLFFCPGSLLPWTGLRAILWPENKSVESWGGNALRKGTMGHWVNPLISSWKMWGPEADKKAGISSQEPVKIHFNPDFLSVEELPALPMFLRGRKEVKGNQNSEKGISREASKKPCWNISNFFSLLFIESTPYPRQFSIGCCISIPPRNTWRRIYKLPMTITT